MDINYPLLLLCTILLATSCRKDVDQFVPQLHSGDPMLVKGTVLGKVRSLNGASLADAQIDFHGNMTTTDGSGFFYLPDAEAPELDAMLEVNKPGYFPGYHRLPWTAQTQMQADMTLIPKVLLVSFPVEEGGGWPVAGWIGMEIPAQALQYQTGDPATGEARVYAHLLNPTDPAFLQLAPLGSKGIDLEGNERYLQSFGILALDITDGNGLPLQLVPGKTMNLYFPIPLEMNASAPAMIPLWSFQPQQGTWVEQSSAERYTEVLDPYYKATATKGSYFWNIATSPPLIQVKGWVRLPEGNPATGVQIRVEAENGLLLAQGATQNQGQFLLDLPANTPATLKLLDLCGEIQQTQSLPSLSGNVSLTPIQWSADDAVSVSGKLLDCEGAPVAEGFIQVLWSEQEIMLPLKDGVFSAQLPVCPDQVITLIGYDLVRHYQTTPQAFPANSPVEMGNWVLCNDTPEYISFNLDGNVQFGDSPDIAVNGGLSTITEPDLGLALTFEGTTPGTFQVLTQGFTLGDLSAQNTNALDLLLNISRFDPPGGYIIGSFNGKATDSDNLEHQISGVFKLQRD
ncbi:MAG: hypothetical protein IPL49_18745 [Saprospirales bacterium]|nr:hypothetical protein [Saprospirales bacterium]